MEKKKIKTDLWVYELFKQTGVDLDAQSNTIKEIDDALKSVSKRGTGKVGFPEYVGVVKDYLLVIEDNADLSKHIKYDGKRTTSKEANVAVDYVVSSPFFYRKYLSRTKSCKKSSALIKKGELAWRSLS